MFLFNGRLINEAWYDKDYADVKYKPEEYEYKNVDPNIDKNINVGDTYHDVNTGEKYVVSNIYVDLIAKDSGNKIRKSEDELKSFTKFLKKNFDKNNDEINVGDVFVKGIDFKNDTTEFIVDSVVVELKSEDSGDTTEVSKDDLNNVELFAKDNTPYWEKPNVDFDRTGVDEINTERKEDNSSHEYKDPSKFGDGTFKEDKKKSDSSKLQSVYGLIQTVKSINETGTLNSHIDVEKCIKDTVEPTFFKELNFDDYKDVIKNALKENPNFNDETNNDIKTIWSDLFDAYNSKFKGKKETETVSFDFIKWILDKENLEYYNTLYNRYKSDKKSDDFKYIGYQEPSDLYRGYSDKYNTEIPGVRLIKDKDSFSFVNNNGVPLYKDSFKYESEDEINYNYYNDKSRVINVRKEPHYFFCKSSLVIRNPKTNEYEMYTPSRKLVGKYNFAFPNNSLGALTVTTDSGMDIVNNFGESIVPDEILGNIDEIFEETEAGDHVYIIPLKLKDGTEGYLDYRGEFNEGKIPEKLEIVVSYEDVELKKSGGKYGIAFKKNFGGRKKGNAPRGFKFKVASESNGVFIVSEEGYRNNDTAHFDYVDANERSLTGREGNDRFFYASPFNNESISIAISYERSEKRKGESHDYQVFVFAIEAVGNGKINVIKQAEFEDIETKNGKPVFDENNISKYPFISLDNDGKKGVVYFNGSDFVNGVDGCKSINFDKMTVIKDGKKYKLKDDYTLGDEIVKEKSSKSETKAKKEETAKETSKKKVEKEKKQEEKKAKSNEKLKEKVKK